MDTIQGATHTLTDRIKSLYLNAFVSVYILAQRVLSFIFAPSAPAPPSQRDGWQLRRPRIAVVGAGLTGVSAASHCVGHGFDVKIFEARSKEKGLGGIWSVCTVLPDTHAYST